MAFEVQQLSYEAIEALRPLVSRIRDKDRSLADQLMRAASSVALNIAEADGLETGNRRMRYLTALGSAKESRAALRVARGWRHVGVAEADVADALLDRIAAMLWKLTRR